MNIQGYNFDGPWLLGQIFNNVPGIYVVFTSQKWLDVGETDNAEQRLNGDNHERKSSWISNSDRLPINIAFLIVNSITVRSAIESRLRQILDPVCGEK